MRYEVNANTFMQLPYTTGTIQNVSDTDIEISNEQTIGTGIVLKAGETFAFNNVTVYACARPVLNGGTGIISVVPFNGEGEGGESPIYVPKGSVAFASLPTTLNSTMLGWTYNVSDAFTTDNRFVEGSGIDYPAGENVVVVEASTGVFNYDCFGGAYILPVANTTTLGGVKSSAVDGTVSVDNDGVMKINLPTASTTVKGGIKVGTGVEVVNEKLNVKVATANEVAGVLSSADEGKVTVNNDGTMTYNPLGYRQPSTTYEVGDIKYHSALPTGWYLECTTAGISGSGDLTISSPSIGGTVSDGTVTWRICNVNANTNYQKIAMARHTRTTFTLANLISAVADQNLAKYGIKVGDYYVGASGYTYIVAGLNPLKGTHKNTVTNNHCGLIVCTHATHPWNASGNTYTGADERGAGYANSDLHYYLVNTVLPKVKSDLGESHLYAHQKLFSNAVNTPQYNRFGTNSGGASSWGGYNQYISALTEHQVYGGIAWSSSGFDTGEADQQLEVFKKFKHTDIFGNEYVWLRDVASASYACRALDAGDADYSTASNASYVAALIAFH